MPSGDNWLECKRIKGNVKQINMIFKGVKWVLSTKPGASKLGRALGKLVKNPRWKQANLCSSI